MITAIEPRRSKRCCIAMLLLLAAPLIQAHPEDAWLHQARALAQWIEAVSMQDAAAIRSLTATGTEPYAPAGAETFVSAHATFSPDAEGVTVGPLVMLLDGGTLKHALSLRLVEEAGDWKVAGFGPAQLPQAFVRDDLPELVATRAVAFSLQDQASGAPVHARVRITDSNGDYWPPDGHQKHIRTGWRQDVGGDVSLDGAAWAYVSPTFTARLPDGEYVLEVRKGMEYLPGRTTFTVGGDAPRAVELSMSRWVHMAARGWHAGDTHTHFLDDHTAWLEARAEDLSMVYVLATKWGELITDVAAFTGRPSPVSTADALVVVNQETRHAWLGHTILHGIDTLVYPLSWGGPNEGVAGGIDYPPMAHQADRAHNQGGLVTWAHFPFPGGELPVDIALGKVDTVDLLTWNDAFAPGPTFGAMTLPSTAESWYGFLNTNARLPATAGTDKMVNVQVTGSVRTYALTGEKFSYRAWLDALDRGATMVTTGPIVSLTANGQPIGAEVALTPGEPVNVEAKVEAPHGLYPVEVLEIVVGGEIVAATPNPDHASELVASARIEPQKSTWVAARARGSKLLPLQKWPSLNDEGIPPMAHTSPVYLIVDGQPIWDADAARRLEAGVDRAIQWATEQAKFSSEAQREEVVELFRRAKAYYAEGPGGESGNPAILP